MKAQKKIEFNTPSPEEVFFKKFIIKPGKDVLHYLPRLFEKEKIAESIGIILIFLIVQRTVGLARGIMFARFLGPTDYGLFTLASFFILFVASFAVLGIPSCYGRYVPQYERRHMLKHFFIKTCSLTIVTGIFITVLLIAFSGQVSRLIYGTSDYKAIIVLASLVILPLILFRHIHAAFTGLRIFKMSSLLEFTQVCFFTVIGIGLVIYFPRPESAIFSHLIGLIFAVLLFSFVLWKYALSSEPQNVRIQENKFYSKIFKFTIWAVVFSVVGDLLSYTDRWMLNHFIGLHEVGIYS
ncbi:MAG: oligosaccharide flippase family protein, partial [Deltaproteobacteria bacterium]|nr:oligosaccharide flippase family protein [Deltaproteobacteria bacterium]